MFLIRFPFYFALSFIILSIPISGNTVFDHMTNSISPVIKKTVKKVKSWGQGALEDTKSLTVKAMNNVKPQVDEVRSSQSSTKPKVKEEDIDAHPNYTDEEKELLIKILEESEN